MIVQAQQPARLSVFLVPAEDDYRYADALIRILSEQYNVPAFEPHVTLYSGKFPDVGALVSAVRRVIYGVASFLLQVHGVDWQEEYFRTLYIRLDESPPLRALHEGIRAACGIDTGYRLNPHLSLLYCEMSPVEKQALARRIVLDRETMVFNRIKIVSPLNPTEGWRDTSQWHTLLSADLVDSS